MVFFLASIAIAFFVSFLCSLLEAVVLSITPSEIAQVSARHPKVGAIWRDFKEHIDRPIGVILILNTAAHTIGATLAGAQFEVLYGKGGLIWFSLLFTYLMLQFTEILPKTLGVYHSRRLAPAIAFVLVALIRAFTPLLRVIHFVNRPFERTKEKARLAPLEELTALAGLARLSNLISSHQERIIHGTSQLSRKSSLDVMIPADQVTFISTLQSIHDAIVTAHLDPHTRFPICEAGNKDRVLGYVNFKELIYRLRTNPADASLRGIIRPVHFVPPEQSASEMLRAFIERHEHMAIVRDSTGRTLGLVTLEDIVEELVGELEDEFDRLPRMLHSLSGGTWMVGGGIPVAELSSNLEVTLPDAHGTVSAWLTRRLGRAPKVNDVHQESGVEFLVRRTRRGKAFEISVTRLPAPIRA